MRRAWLHGVAAVGVALATVPLVGAPNATGLAVPSVASLVAACNRGSGASGFATAPDGSPLASAAVLVDVEPNPARERVGQQVRLVRLGMARTTVQGCYSIALHASPGLIGSADRFGVVNLRITLLSGRSEQLVDLPRRLVSTGSQLALRRIGRNAPLLPLGLASSAARTATLSGALHQSFGPQATTARAQSGAMRGETAAAGPAAITIPTGAGMPGAAPTQLGAQPMSLVSPNADTVVPAVTSQKVLHVYNKHPILVGQWWSRMTGVQETWSYSQGSTSELQIGVSVSGKAGSFSAGSTRGSSTNATVTFPRARGRSGTYYRSYWTYAKYKVTDCTISKFPVCKSHYEVKPYRWERGTQVTRNLAPPAVKRRNCSPYAAGSTDESAHGKAVTWSNGVEITGDLKGILGANISLSSQTGFSTEAHNVVHFSRHGTLCGIFAPLSDNPGALEARRWG